MSSAQKFLRKFKGRSKRPIASFCINSTVCENHKLIHRFYHHTAMTAELNRIDKNLHTHTHSHLYV